jgi:CheY-like chemotaxis protein
MARRVRDRRQLWGRRRSDIFWKRDRPRVLVIEPHEDTRLLYIDLFEASGYAVESASDGLTGIAHARMRLPDVVVTEMIVPGADGFEILGQLRADPSTKSIPCIVVTSYLHFEVPERARAAGAVVVLAKPLSPATLLAEVDTVIIETPRARLIERQLRRALILLRDLAQRFKVDDDIRQCVPTLIDSLQVAVLAVDEAGRYVAVSDGAATLTGYAREELLRMSISDSGWSINVPMRAQNEEYPVPLSATTTTMRNREGQLMALYTTMVTILPGLHAAACAPLD